VGDGPAREKLAHENPDFIFCGIQRGDALARHFASGDLFLFPSRSETFGNVTLESMASGRPPSPSTTAPREYLRNGENGAAVDNDEQFIEAAVQLAADDARRRELGSSAARAMKRLHPQQVVAEFDALLAELAQSRRSGHAHHAA
jgi:glycosyltransferase involved in cell wall biosynthesis